MILYRCHVVWDRVPGIGILDRWARALGFKGKPVAVKTYYAVYTFQGLIRGQVRTI
jgi:hypothetical protein